jgi:phosphomannomutase/phosphomannomutase/phosphoglucomutase
MTEQKLACFKAYDVRGRVPDDLDEELTYRIGRAFAEQLQARTVVVGRDVRLSSQGFVTALSRGLTDAGVKVLDIGLCGTELIYFATSHLGTDGGIMVTASHNPMGYNGLKFVARDSVPLSGESGLPELERRCVTGDLGDKRAGGSAEQVDVADAYVEHLLSYVKVDALAPLRVVTDPGNGCAGPWIDRLAPSLPYDLVRVCHEPDGTFPNGIPNPMLEENRARTSEAVLASRAAVGLAWDGDFDRCFFFDEQGRFVEGYYLVGLLAEATLKKHPGAKIIHDPRLTWNTQEMVKAAGGRPIQSRCGHAFIKAAMRSEDAWYGGEMSAHHYFQKFFYCDSGMIPWLLVLEQLGADGRPFSELLAERMAAFPVSGEINRRIADADACIAAVEARYKPDALDVDYTDGIAISFSDWRFNLRKSNTEPLVRLNVEARGDAALMKEKTEELLVMLR